MNLFVRKDIDFDRWQPFSIARRPLSAGGRPWIIQHQQTGESWGEREGANVKQSAAHIRLRALTLKFFERGMGALAILRREFDEFPKDEEARRRWVREIRAFADRAQALAAKWEELFPEYRRESPSAPTRDRRHADTPTPVA